MLQQHGSQPIFRQASLRKKRPCSLSYLGPAPSFFYCQPKNCNRFLGSVAQRIAATCSSLMPEMHLKHSRGPADSVQCQLFNSLIWVSLAHAPSPSREHLHRFRTPPQLSFLKQSCRKNSLTWAEQPLLIPSPNLKTIYSSNSNFLHPSTSAFSSCNSTVLTYQAFHPPRPSNLSPIWPTPKASL